MRIAILGGTGNEGQGLALRWAAAGHEILIGSRERQKAERVAGELRERLEGTPIRGLPNEEAARQGELAVLTVPYAAHRPTLEGVAHALRGKILVDVTVPLDPHNPRRVSIPAEGPAAVQAQRLLGAGTRVVAAFHNVSHTHLQHLDQGVDCDVLVCGDDPQAKEAVIALAHDAGLRALDAGPLENAAVAEGLTAVLIQINLRHKVKGAGVRITGLP